MASGKLTEVLTKLFDEAGKRADHQYQVSLSGQTIIRAVRDPNDKSLFTFIAANYGTGIEWKEWHTFMRYVNQTEAYRPVADERAQPWSEAKDVNTLTGKSIHVRKFTKQQLLELEQKRQEQEAAANPQDSLFDIPF